jgi:cytochrome b
MNQSIFSDRYSFSIRAWHWLTFLVTFFLLFTIAVSKTFLNGQHTFFVISHTTSRYGAKLTGQQVGETVIALRATIWKWHTKAGYLLSGLFAFRILVEIFERRSITGIKKAFSAFKLKTRKDSRLYLLVKITYLVFYCLFATITFTGLWMAFYKNDPSINDEKFHGVKEIHEACFNFILLFILFHLAGVIRAELGKHKNLVSGMIHGNKEFQIIPKTTDHQSNTLISS